MKRMIFLVSFITFVSMGLMAQTIGRIQQNGSSYTIYGTNGAVVKGFSDSSIQLLATIAVSNK